MIYYNKFLNKEKTFKLLRKYYDNFYKILLFEPLLVNENDYNFIETFINEFITINNLKIDKKQYEKISINYIDFHKYKYNNISMTINNELCNNFKILLYLFLISLLYDLNTYYRNNECLLISNELFNIINDKEF